MASQPAPTTPDDERPSSRDIWEVAHRPALFAIITAAAAWLIWYYTNTPCTLELAERTTCNPAVIARYINVDIYGRMLTYAAITAAAGGVWNYNMFTKMRAAIATEKQRADTERQRADAAQQRAAAEQQRAAAEQQRAAAALQQMAEYRQQVEEERRQAAEERQRRMEEDRRVTMQQNAEINRAMLTALAELTAEIAQLRQQRNGNAQNEH